LQERPRVHGPGVAPLDIFVMVAWATSIVLVWMAVAVDLGQPIWQRQHSFDLVAYGAFEGRSLTFVSGWKVLASQWLHVKFPHMMFNAAIIGIVGAALTNRLAWPAVIAVGLVGGACGQLAASVFQPEAYVSGASQAYLSLCGLALLLLDRRGFGLWAAVLGVAVSVFLDVFISGHSAIKPGHLIAFVVGLTAGGLILLMNERRPQWAILRRC